MWAMRSANLLPLRRKRLCLRLVQLQRSGMVCFLNSIRFITNGNWIPGFLAPIYFFRTRLAGHSPMQKWNLFSKSPRRVNQRESDKWITLIGSIYSMLVPVALPIPLEEYTMEINKESWRKFGNVWPPRRPQQLLLRNLRQMERPIPTPWLCKCN